MINGFEFRWLQQHGMDHIAELIFAQARQIAALKARLAEFEPVEHSADDSPARIHH